MKTQIIVHITLKLSVCHNRLKLLKKEMLAPTLMRYKWFKEHTCFFFSKQSQFYIFSD